MTDIAGVVVSAVACVAQCLPPLAGCRVNLWREFKSNFQNLKKEVETLKAETRNIQLDVDAAKRNGDGIKENVQKWLERAEELEANFQKWLERASKFIGDDQVAGKIRKEDETAAAAAAATAGGEIGGAMETVAAAGEIKEETEIAAEKKRCFKCWCPRYQLSKEAVMQLEAVVKHREEAEKFGNISYPTIPKDPRLSNNDYEAFESRTSTLKNVISSLSDPDINIVGIYGMGGIGKTMLAKEVAKQPETNKLFDSVIFVEVTEKPNITKIQQEIAEKLGLQLYQEETGPTRAGKLCQRLENEKSILIILDNIWTHIDLLAIGISLRVEHKGCKALFTARSVDVLEKMDSQTNFPVGLLNDAEAWQLFKKMSRDNIQGSEFESMAREVVKKCAHLPIVIVTVARALRNKELFAWRNASQQMGLSSSADIRHIHASIELSFNYLESDVLKKTILLIRYANMTSVNELLMYGMSLGLFEGANKMEERRDRVCTLVQQLKDSCLLLDNYITDEDFSMHDVVRDVAMSIASREGHAFTNELFDEWEWPDVNTLSGCQSIILKDVKRGELPQVLECQQLKLLYLSGYNLKIPDMFFTRMTKLKVLVLAKMRLLSLPSSLRLLKNLRALGLYGCQLDDIAPIKDLKQLEIISLKYSKLKKFPVEVGHLTQIKSLDLRTCDWSRLYAIPPNVISSLSLLEELYIGEFDQWEEKGLNKEENASLDELKHLSNLTSLEIKIKNAKTLPRDLFFKKLKRYKIEIGSSTNIMQPKICRKFNLTLSNTNICLKDGHIMKLRGIEDLSLDGSLDMDSVVFGLDGDGFQQLKYLQVRENANVLCIVDSMEDATRIAVFPVLESLLIKNLINLEKICRQLTTELSFGQLRKINVEFCHKLEDIFSFSIARRLQLLQSIDICYCSNMKYIFALEREDESKNNIEVFDGIVLNQLRSLKLYCLPRLKSLEYNSNRSSTLFSGKVDFPSLKELMLHRINVERIWQNQVAAISLGYPNLTRLFLWSCNNLRCLFSFPFIKSFAQLQRLEIESCRGLEEIAIIDERKDVVFPQLQFLSMKDLESLSKFCSGDSIEFPSLRKLKIRNCPKLKEFLVKNNSTDLIEVLRPFFNEKAAVPSLEELILENIDVERIWRNQVAVFSSGIQNLTSLILSNCKNLRCLFSSSMIRSFDRLRVLEIFKCPVLEEIMIIDDEDGLIEEESEINVAFPISKRNNYLKMNVSCCDKLKTLFPLNMSRKFMRLESLSVSYCSSLELIFDVEGPDFEDQLGAVVSQLRKLNFNNLPKLKYVWNKDPKKFLSFKKLKSVGIFDCERLKNVFPASVACSLSQLEGFVISRCGVEEIFFAANDGAETAPNFVFPKVRFLNVDELPKFTTFFPGIYTTEWPTLETLMVDGWEMVMNLGFQGSNKERHPQFLAEKVFPNLKNLTINGMGITTIWKFPEDLTCKLKYLEVKFDESTVILSLDFLKKFRTMTVLQILGGYFASDTKERNGMLVIRYLNKCYVLKHILEEESNMDHLARLEVEECDNLVHLVPSLTSFRNLTSLKVKNCKRLTNIVTASTAKSLVQLREMTIQGCNMITEIVAVDEGDEAKDYEIIFKELNELYLYGLESLTSFCSTNCTLEFPSLEKLTVGSCPKMKSFFEGTLSTPKLQKVKRHWRDDQGCWKGDLNTTMKEAQSSEVDFWQLSDWFSYEQGHFSL